MQLNNKKNSSFWEAVDEHYRAVFRFAWRMLGNREAAEDVAQEAFARLAQSGPEDKAETSRRWVFVVARNLCVSELRKWNRHAETALMGDPPAATATPREAASHKETGELIAHAVQTLPIAMREALILREYEGLSYEEIAVVAGCSVGTVRSRLARARQRVQEQLRSVMEIES